MPGFERHLAGPFAALGHRFGLESDDRSLVDAMSWLYAALRADGQAEHHYAFTRVAATDRFDIAADGEPAIEGIPRTEIFDWFQWRLNREAVQSVESGIVLHAACAEKDRRAILLAGESGAGKSTLVASLVLAGMAYLTDEACAITPRSRVVAPYPRPLSLSRASLDLLGIAEPENALLSGDIDRKVPVPISAVRDGVPGSGSEPALVVVLEPRGAPTTSAGLVRLTAAEAARELVRTAFDFWRDPREGLETLSTLVAGAETFAAAGLEAPELADLLLERFEASNHAT